MDFTQPHVSTMVCTAKIDANFNLRCIYQYLDVNEQIVGIKLGDKHKGIQMSKKKSFRNQISIIVLVSGRKINVKLFANGAFTLSGVKDVAEVKIAIDIIYASVKKIKGYRKINAKIDKGILLYKNQILIRSKKVKALDIYKVIGIKNEEEYQINGERLVLFEDTYLISKVHSNWKTNLYNFNYEKIGHTHYDLKRKSKHLFLKGSVLVKDAEYSEMSSSHYRYEIYDKYSNMVGYHVINIDQQTSLPWQSETNSQMEVILAYKAVDNPDIISDYDVKIVNMNYNFEVLYNKSNFRLDRIELNNTFSTNKEILKVNFNPLKYPGLMIRFKDEHSDQHITVTFFESGNILVFGLKFYTQIKSTYDFIKALLLDEKQKLTEYLTLHENIEIKKELFFKQETTEKTLFDFL